MKSEVIHIVENTLSFTHMIKDSE